MDQPKRQKGLRLLSIAVLLFKCSLTFKTANVSTLLNMYSQSQIHLPLTVCGGFCPLFFTIAIHLPIKKCIKHVWIYAEPKIRFE